MKPLSEKTKKKISESNKITKQAKFLKKFGHIRTDIQKKIRKNVSSLLGTRLRNRLSSKNNKSTFDILKFSVEELMQHLESKFQPGMTWDNYGIYGWHIDHIKPDVAFIYKSIDDEDFKKCWALDNLQPLWAKDNLRKSYKYEEV
jgi:hypothetical protein